MKNLRLCLGLCVVIAFVLAIGVPAMAKEQVKAAAKEEVKAVAKEEVKVNINKATVKELTKLKQVGPKVAEKIVEFREKNGPFKKPEDIMKVPGIGPKIFEQNKGTIILDDLR